MANSGKRLHKAGKYERELASHAKTLMETRPLTGDDVDRFWEMVVEASEEQRLITLEAIRVALTLLPPIDGHAHLQQAYVVSRDGNAWMGAVQQALDEHVRSLLRGSQWDVGLKIA